jgi:carbonic anhydrase/acetyltransferase-like protein (isoleucine patch superfamily)
VTNEKKYEFTGEEKDGLKRIRAIRDFGDVESGDLGGFVGRERNLSHKGNAWVCDGAKVSGNAQVYENAQVCDDAHVCGDAQVYGNAQVGGNAQVCDDAHVFGDAQVYGNALVGGNAKIYGNAQVCDDAKVYGNAHVFGNAHVSDDAKVYGNAHVSDNALVCDGALVCDATGWLTVGPIGSRNGFTTFFRTKDGIGVVCGCFHGTLDEFRACVKKTHRNNGHAVAYRAAISIAELRIGRETADGEAAK